MKDFIRPRWMNIRFGGSDNSPEKRDGDLVAMVDALAERVAKLEANSHPPIDLTPAIAEILAELGYAVPAHAPPTDELKAAYALYQKRIEPEPAVPVSDLAQVTAERDQLLADLERVGCPPGYRVLNDGPGREVLVHDDDEECPVFETKVRAVLFAWANYEPEEA